VGYKKDTKNESDMKTAEEKEERYANLMIAVAVIAGIYFVVWTLIGMVL